MLLSCCGANISSVKIVFQNGLKEKGLALYAEPWLGQLIYGHLGMDQQACLSRCFKFFFFFFFGLWEKDITVLWYQIIHLDSQMTSAFVGELRYIADWRLRGFLGGSVSVNGRCIRECCTPLHRKALCGM